MRKYSIVLPIKVIEQIEQAGIKLTNGYVLFKHIGLPSYRKFLNTENLDKFYIIAPKREVRLVETLFEPEEKIPFKVLDEESLLSKNLQAAKGWLKQQIIKLSAAFLVKTDYYLVIDSDHFLTQEMSSKNLFTETKIIYHSEPWQTENSDKFSTNSSWWINSSRLLSNTQLPTSGLMSVTPQILISSVVQNLIERIKLLILEKNKLLEAENLKIKDDDSWQTYLCEAEFTEFTLYWIYALNTSQADNTSKISSLYSEDASTFPIRLWAHDHDVNVLRTNCNKNKVSRALREKRSLFSVIQGYISQQLEPYVYEFHNFFSKNMDTYDAIFLTSSMLCPNRAQSLTLEERFNQTLNTLNSIKKAVPNSLCILIEGTQGLTQECKNMFEYHYDHVIYAREDVLPFVNHPKNIGHGEMKLLEKGIDFLLKSKVKSEENPFPRNIVSKKVIKLGARYSLTSNFSLANISEEKYTFKKKYDHSVDSDVFITGLYGIPYARLEEFRKILIKGQDVLSNTCPMIEKLFVDLIPKEEISTIDPLGLEGILSFNKEKFEV